jgi:hypothetical protein
MAAMPLPLTTPVMVAAPVPPRPTVSWASLDRAPPASLITTFPAVSTATEALGTVFVERPAPLPLNWVPAVTDPGNETDLTAIFLFYLFEIESQFYFYSREGRKKKKKKAV